MKYIIKVNKKLYYDGYKQAVGNGGQLFANLTERYTAKRYDIFEEAQNVAFNLVMVCSNVNLAQIEEVVE